MKKESKKREKKRKKEKKKQEKKKEKLYSITTFRHVHKNNSSDDNLLSFRIAFKLSNQVTIILAGPFGEQSDNQRKIPSRRNCAR